MSNKQKLGLVIGRFQPFHMGHLKLIQKAQTDCDRVLILVGSADQLPNYKNPLPYDLRLELIRKQILVDKNTFVAPLNDYPTDEEWVQEITGRVLAMEENPSDTTVYTSDKDEEFYRSSFVFPIEKIISKIDATYIRKQMYENDVLAPGTMTGDVKLAMAAFMDTPEFKHLRREYDMCKKAYATSLIAHAHNNPIEPVVHAMVVYKGNILLIRRNGIRGHGQLALPGGFLERTETTRAGAIRELKEETGIDLMELKCRELSTAVEENVNGLSTRTLAINYCYVISNDEEVNVVIDEDEVQEYIWHPYADVMAGKVPLFYNHLTIARRLSAAIPQEPEKN